MTPSELATRVTLDTCLAVAALAALAGWLMSAPIGVGVLAGGALAVVNFRWLVARAFVATELGSTSTAAWILGAGLRFAVCTATGSAHPLALVAGFTVLPCDLIARGLMSARTEG
jgi:ATP synthase I subunit